MYVCRCVYVLIKQKYIYAKVLAGVSSVRARFPSFWAFGRLSFVDTWLSKTPLFAAPEPLGRSKTPLFAAPEPLRRSNGCSGMPRSHCGARVG